MTHNDALRSLASLLHASDASVLFHPVASFVANPNRRRFEASFTDQVGVWTARVRIKAKAGGGPGCELVSVLPVKQLSVPVSGPPGPGTVTNVFVYGQLAKASGQGGEPGDHQLAFVASPPAGNTLYRAIDTGAPRASGRPLEIVGP